MTVKGNSRSRKASIPERSRKSVLLKDYSGGWESGGVADYTCFIIPRADS